MLIAIVTSLYPTRNDPHRGQPIHHTVRALRQMADIRVLCAHAAYPGRSRPGSDGSDEPGVEIVDYPAVPLLSRPWNGSICSKRVHERLRAIRPDVVLNYWLYPEGYAAVRAARQLQIPVIVGARGSDLRRIPEPLTLQLVTKTLNRANHVLAVSEDLRNHALAMGVPPERATTVLNGCDPELFHGAGREKARAVCGVAAGERILLYVGRLVKSKGLLDLFAAFSTIAREFPDVRLVCVGDGPLRNSLASQIERGDLSKRVTLTHALLTADVAQWMRAADLFCLPSYSEGCPNVVLEALASGCPVVATAVGGVPEIARPEGSILLPPGDPRRLAEELREGLSRAWDRDAIAKTCTRTWDHVARETMAVCEQVAGAGKAPAVVSRRRMRITLVSSYFPSSTAPSRGHSAYHTLIPMSKSADIQVLCPLATYSMTGGPPDERRYGPFETRYFGYPAVPMLTRPMNGRTCLRRLLPLLRETKPDVILNYWLYPEGFSAVQAGRMLGVPSVVGAIGSDLRRIGDPFTRHFVERTMREASGVITVSEELRTRALAMGLPPEKVTAILNGCDHAVFYPRDQREARAHVGYTGDGPLILYVGNLLITKGLRELLTAFKSLSARRPDARLAMIGQGPFEAEARAFIERHQLQDRVLLLGYKPSTEVGAWMGASNLLCLPSHSEGCPNVVVEALGCGVPVVGCDVGGMSELVQESTGILIPPRDAGALEKALESALEKRWNRREIATTSGRNWDDVAADTLEFCRQVIEGNQRGTRAARTAAG